MLCIRSAAKQDILSAEPCVEIAEGGWQTGGKGAVVFDGKLQSALRKDGQQGIAEPFLPQRFQGEVGGRESGGVDGDSVRKQIDFAMGRGCKTDIFGEEKGDGQGVLG